MDKFWEDMYVFPIAHHPRDRELAIARAEGRCVDEPASGKRHKAEPAASSTDGDAQRLRSTVANLRQEISKLRDGGRPGNDPRQGDQRQGGARQADSQKANKVRRNNGKKKDKKSGDKCNKDSARGGPNGGKGRSSK